MAFNQNIKNKKSLILNTLIFMGAHIGSKLTDLKNTKTNSFIFFIEKKIYFFNIKRIIRDLKQSLFFIKKIISNGGFILIITGFKIENKKWIQNITSLFEKYNICIINKEWSGGLLTNIFGLKKTFNDFRYNPKLPVKTYYTKLIISKLKKKRKQQINLFFDRFDILEKLYFLPNLLLLLNNFSTQEGNNELLKEIIRLDIPSIALVKNANYNKYIDFPIFCNNQSIIFIKFYLTLIKKTLRFFK